ncbi:MAG: hypothetical protein A2138_00265 [Deltaproteobacteria bacterium RBG_16_71_12]|nr:MAG: hypothetical protein A2138_00265 [Deltaproteobacteria bacterium RBG_16_71_12]HJW75508.1 MarR family winged helix-turn-helix transcriptional regulator [Thermoleophilia bacterium]
MFDDPIVEKLPMGRVLELLRQVWAVDHAVQQLSRAMASHLGLTGPQRLVLRVIGRRPRISAGELAAFLHLDASTMTGHLQKLEELGLLERRVALDDARRAAIVLTPRGRRLDTKTPGTIEAAMEEALGEMNPAAIDEAERFLKRFAVALTRQTAACETRKRRPRRRTR